MTSRSFSYSVSSSCKLIQGAHNMCINKYAARTTAKMRQEMTRPILLRSELRPTATVPRTPTANNCNEQRRTQSSQRNSSKSTCIAPYPKKGEMHRQSACTQGRAHSDVSPKRPPQE